MRAPVKTWTARSSMGRPLRSENLAGHQGARPDHVVDHGLAQLRDAVGEPAPLEHVGHRLLIELAEHLPHRQAHRLDRVELGGLAPPGFDQDRIEGVVDDHVLLAAEVAEERAGRDLGGLGYLLDGGRVVASLPKQPKRVLLNEGTRLHFLAFA